MSPPAVPSQIARFCQVWAECFSRFLESVGVASQKVEATEPAPAQSPTAEEFEKLVCVRFSGGGSIQGELLWVADKPAALQLAQVLMSEPLDPAVEFGDIQRDASAELFRQVAGQAASAWKKEVGAETDIFFQATVDPAPVAAQSVSLKLSGEKFPELSIRLFLNEDLCAALTATPLKARAAPPPPLQREEAAQVPAAVRTGSLPANLSLVLDVELEATIRFGEREMPLRDIFGLMPGAIIELDQMVNEPAQLLVAGRLVARGEVVVVDGNFGLRVTEVASVSDRVAAIPM
jgi:flagellar motor switch protein FliN/FliY